MYHLVAAIDDRTKDSHAGIDGEKRELDELFSNGLMQPGDPAGPPEETINCRCTVTSILKDFDFAEKQELQKKIGKKDLQDEGDAGIIVNMIIEPTSASSAFVNKNDQLCKNAQNIKQMPGFEDVVVHSDADNFYLYGNDGTEHIYSPKAFAEILKNSQNYSGGNVRLIACEAGAKSDGAAQMLADELNTTVMASNTLTWTYPNGDVIVGTTAGANDGLWKIFNPR